MAQMMRGVSAFAAVAALAASLTSFGAAGADEISQAPGASISPVAHEKGGPALARARARGLVPRGLSFESNRGQSDPAVRFLARGRGYGLFLTGDEAVFVLRAPLQVDASRPHRRAAEARWARPPIPRSTSAQGSLVRMRLKGADPNAVVVGLEELPGRANYLTGKDAAQWRTEVPRYARVSYRGVYPGVDLVYYAGPAGELEYDFVVAPGADPSKIALTLEGSDAVDIDAQGDVVVRASAGELRLRKPLVYQEVGGERRTVPSRYVLGAESGSRGREIRFHVAHYDPSRPLVIDPVLIYSTYLGGANSLFGAGDGFSFAEGVAVDEAGNTYVTGVTSAIDFPIRHPLPGQVVGSTNIFVTKIDPGGAIVYSTYLGRADDAACCALNSGAGIAVDASGNAYVTGLVDSPDFPTTPGAYRSEFNADGDIFVTKLNRSGSQLLYSTFLGGRSAYGLPGPLMGIAIDSEGHAFVAGITDSAGFPTKNAVQAQYGGEGDAFVVKLNRAGSDAVYSTFLGGRGREYPAKVAVDALGNAYVAGSTDSPDFPTRDAFQSKLNGDGSPYFVGGGDAFITKLDPRGALVYSTYFGGVTDDLAYDIAVDAGGSAHIVGITLSDGSPSLGFPLLNPLQVSAGVTLASFRYIAFIAKLNPQGSGLVYSSYFGTTNLDTDCSLVDCTEQANGIAVDGEGNAYIAGLTKNPDFPVTGDAFQPQSGDPPRVPGDYSFRRVDAFVAQFDPTGTVLRYSTFLGGNAVDDALDIAINAAGAVAVAGYTESPDFPARNAVQPQRKGSLDAFVTHLNFSPAERGPLQFVTFPAGLPSLPPTAVLGQPYLGNVGIGGGQPPYRVRLERGALPAGLRLGLQEAAARTLLAVRSGPNGAAASPATLEPGDVGGPIVDGTPQEPGDACFVVSVRDAVDSVGVAKLFRITTVGAGQPPTAPPTLQVKRAGSGTGRVGIIGAGAVAVAYCEDDCVRPYAVCDDVQLIAEAAPGSFFAGWNGGGCGDGDECRVLMSRDVVVTGRFEAYPHLTVWREGSGEGQVASVPGGIACGAQCDAPYAPGTVVRLTATPEEGATFGGWIGSCSGTGPCEVTVDQTVAVGARFDRVAAEPRLSLVAAILPGSRSVRVGTAATVSATVIATGVGLAVGCTVGLDGSPPVTLAYQAYDVASGLPTGTANEPVSLVPGVPQALLLSVTPTAVLAPTELVPRFACANADPAPPLSGVNTLWLSAAEEAPADVVVLVSTPSHDGIVRVNGVPGAAAFALATVNVGAGDELTLTADTGGVPLPVSLLVCETEASGQCIGTPGTSARRRIDAGGTPTYTVLVLATGAVAPDAARHRVYLRFHDAAGTLRGAASVAVQTADLTLAAGGR